MVFELIGWSGTFAILLAYFLVTTKNLMPDDSRYQLLNIFGAFGIIFNSWVHRAIPSIGLNFVWLLIGLYGFIKSTKS